VDLEVEDHRDEVDLQVDDNGGVVNLEVDDYRGGWTWILWSRWPWRRA